MILFLVATVLAFSRQLYQAYLPGLKPAYVFIICGILSFFITHNDGKRLLVWRKTQKNISWDLMYVFAGGLAAGTLINSSGAAAAIGELVSNSNLSGAVRCENVSSLDFVSCTLGDTQSANGLGENPIPYIYVASIGVNLSYMLPTSIRAIPVGYGLEPKYMLKKGIPITIVVIILMSVMGWLMMEYWPMFSTV